jgi:hypothetical protein
MSFGSYDSNKSAYSGILEAKADGYISYTHKDGKTSISMSDSGMTLQDANECKIESGSSLVSGSKGIVINGKLKIKG